MHIGSNVFDPEHELVGVLYDVRFGTRDGRVISDSALTVKEWTAVSIMWNRRAKFYSPVRYVGPERRAS
jgi:hypothetical protein